MAVVPAADAAVANDSINMLEEVVVTGSNHAVSARLMPYTVSVVDRQQLDAAGSTELLTVLSGQVPSLFVTQRGISLANFRSNDPVWPRCTS